MMFIYSRYDEKYSLIKVRRNTIFLDRLKRKEVKEMGYEKNMRK